MSQAGLIDIEASHPQIPTQFNADTGSAIPIGNQLNVFGGTGIDTTASGMTVTISAELATAGATVGDANIGSSAYNSADFNVVDGFVSLIPGSGGTDDYVTDSGTATQVGGSINVVGTAPISTSGVGDTVTVAMAIPLEVQYGGTGRISLTNGALVIGDGTNPVELLSLTDGQLPIGVTGGSPSAAQLTAGSGITITNGPGSIEISLEGGGTAIDSITIDDAGAGTNPVVPDSNGNITMTGTTKDNDATKPVDTRSDGANSFQIRVQRAIASNSAAASLSSGIAYYFDEDFTVSAAARVDLVDTVVKSVAGDSGTATPSGHSFTIAGDTGLSTAGASDTITISLDGSVVGQTITGDSGGALSPTAGNWNIVGGPGITTTGSGSTLTINSVVYTDQTATTLAENSGTWATAAGSYVLPASPSEGDLVEIVCITTGIVVTANTGQEIELAGSTSSTAGTATNSAQGDVLVLRYRSTDTRWYATSSMGVWVLA